MEADYASEDLGKTQVRSCKEARSRASADESCKQTGSKATEDGHWRAETELLSDARAWRDGLPRLGGRVSENVFAFASAARIAFLSSSANHWTLPCSPMREHQCTPAPTFPARARHFFFRVSGRMGNLRSSPPPPLSGRAGRTKQYEIRFRAGSLDGTIYRDLFVSRLCYRRRLALAFALDVVVFSNSNFTFADRNRTRDAKWGRPRAEPVSLRRRGGAWRLYAKRVLE